MSMKAVLDTNVLIEFLDVVRTLDAKIILPSFVIEELDNLKTRGGELAYKARNANAYLREVEDLVTIDTCEVLEVEEIPEGLDIHKYDNKILAIAKRHGATVVSGDFGFLYKAKKIFGLDTIDAFKIMPLYTGVKEIYIDETEEVLNEIYSRHVVTPNDNVFGLYPNQYLLIYDKNDPIKAKDGTVTGYRRLAEIKRWTGKEFKNLKLPPERILVGMNDYQLCAMDLALNPDIPIKILAGTYGSGKTLLGIRTAVYMTKELGEYGKILCVRNPVGSGKEIGFLKGDKEAKIQDFFKAIGNNLDGGEQELQKLIEANLIEFDVPFFMKGMSLGGTFMLVDEAEDLTVKELKMVGARVGEGSCVCFCGDYKQAESHYVYDNGLTALINETKDEALVGCVVLQDDVRSKASKVFAKLR